MNIGSNSCIIGHVTIGDNVIIGAGSIVVKDVPSNVVVAGNYQQRRVSASTTVVGRKKIDVNTTSIRTLPEDKWIIAENAHEAIRKRIPVWVRGFRKSSRPGGYFIPQECVY